MLDLHSAARPRPPQEVLDGGGPASCHYDHEWTEGDLIVSNNLTVCHKTGKGVGRPLETQGLRVLHRVCDLARAQPPARSRAHAHPLARASPGYSQGGLGGAQVTVLGSHGLSPAAFAHAAPWLAMPARPRDGYRDLGAPSPSGLQSPEPLFGV